jgi:hypothetical protein
MVCALLTVFENKRLQRSFIDRVIFVEVDGAN